MDGRGNRVEENAYVMAARKSTELGFDMLLGLVTLLPSLLFMKLPNFSARIVSSCSQIFLGPPWAS